MDTHGEGHLSFTWGTELLLYPTMAAQRISTRFAMSLDSATACLIFYSWDEEKLAADLELLSLAVVKDNCSVMDDKHIPKLSTCQLCNIDSVAMNFCCGHVFCHDCFSGYVRKTVEEGNITVCCPSPSGCMKCIPHSTVVEKLNTALAFELQLLTLRHFVAAKQNLTWCPAYKCSILISHQNWNPDYVAVCPVCQVNIKIKDNGKSMVYDDITLNW